MKGYEIIQKNTKVCSKGFESSNRFLFIVSFISFDRIIFLVLTKKGNKIRTYSQQTVKFPIGAKYYTYALHLDSFCTCLICCTCVIKFENKSIDKNSL